MLDEEASLYEGLRRALEGGVKQWYKALVSWSHIDSRAVHGFQAYQQKHLFLGGSWTTLSGLKGSSGPSGAQEG